MIAYNSLYTIASVDSLWHSFNCTINKKQRESKSVNWPVKRIREMRLCKFSNTNVLGGYDGLGVLATGGRTGGGTTGGGTGTVGTGGGTVGTDGSGAPAASRTAPVRGQSRDCPRTTPRCSAHS